MFTDLCFFSIDKHLGINYADGGINLSGHNGYVRDCTSLGPDVPPEAGAMTLLPLSGVKTAKGKGKAAKGAKAAAKSGPTSFYAGMQ
ncbi:hypothetical protein GUITHDRAFT_102364 [Guillardia theta CCMP2712]|uniref:Uncharacterized protein n=1 Tax=Guillardia theta (strain CCMP2712) TaxID=905079 RepID=L1JTL2_GUITC|nr:hypothetical protein GUITHDRAFT_102364 [Guillardia theta CCMP2712]EKX51757.1 hypothetical protein GUITHDRAFT_102364 [Guillardia theta CCMP2712]|eukprot:XP_005838737.1 hypothetical protein GUITHDRAFT_102364 [Guillardia theta CCMP2712]